MFDRSGLSDSSNLRNYAYQALKLRGLDNRPARLFAQRLTAECLDQLRREAEDPLLLFSTRGDDLALARAERILANEGIRRSDLVSWITLPRWQRMLLLRLDQVDREVDFLAELERCNGDPMRATNLIRRRHALYGDPYDLDLAMGEDRPLHPALRIRVQRHLEETRSSEIEWDVEMFTTFNAYVREKSRNGAL